MNMNVDKSREEREALKIDYAINCRHLIVGRVKDPDDAAVFNEKTGVFGDLLWQDKAGIAKKHGLDVRMFHCLSLIPLTGLAFDLLLTAIVALPSDVLIFSAAFVNHPDLANTHRGTFLTKTS